MKTLIGALALVIAAPVVAQSAPAKAPKSDHAQHQPADHGQHEKDCCKDGCCEKMKQQGKTMACCGEKAGDKSADRSDHGKH